MESLYAAKVEGLYKIYPVYENPIDRLKELVVSGERHRKFTALTDIGFVLEKGSTLGIVGENGAGKSTLLQIIAGTLEPTSGTIEKNGDVLGLLELGLGFHDEFSGRENVFLYGDLLGIPRSTLVEKLEEIVDFSELWDSIDQPLKTYSTGMKVRLAFSLIASLNPDILIIDEALAVGDQYFQMKCVEKIRELKERGRSIIFSSHNSYLVNLFCDEVIWLKGGAVEMRGDPHQVIAAYDNYQWKKGHDNQGQKEAKELPATYIESVKILNGSEITTGDNLVFQIGIRSKNLALQYHVMVSLKVEPDWGVFATGTHMQNQPPLEPGDREIKVEFPDIPLLGGYYYLHVRLFDKTGSVIIHERITDPFKVKKESLERGVTKLENNWLIGMPRRNF